MQQKSRKITSDGLAGVEWLRERGSECAPGSVTPAPGRVCLMPRFARSIRSPIVGGRGASGWLRTILEVYSKISWADEKGSHEAHVDEVMS